jgi:uncharacterized protein
MISTLAITLLLAAGAGFQIPPTPAHYVTDTANALSSETRASIENELHTYETATGHQVIVWIGQSTGDVPLETWTGETAHQWRIGRRGHDDGAILFVFMQDHKLRIEVGYGLESQLTDAASDRIIQDVIRPRMRSGDVDGAISSGVAAMLKTISPSYAGVTPPPESSSDDSNAGWVLPFIIVIVVLSILLPIVIQIIVMRRLGHVITSGGARSGGFLGGLASSFSSGGGGGGDFDSGGFSAGGGDFGGGGASGGW